MTAEEKKEAIIEKVKEVYDPELGISIYELGLIYEITVEESDVFVKMTFTSMACPVGPELKASVEAACRAVDGVDSVDVEVIWTPPWDPHTMASEEAKMDLGII